MSISARIKAIQIIDQGKAFSWYGIPSSARKETVDVDILVTFGNNDRKNHRIYHHSEWTSYESKEAEPVQQVQMKVSQGNNCRKDFSWLHFDDEPRVQERQQVIDQQSYNYSVL